MQESKKISRYCQYLGVNIFRGECFSEVNIFWGEYFWSDYFTHFDPVSLVSPVSPVSFVFPVSPVSSLCLLSLLCLLSPQGPDSPNSPVFRVPLAHPPFMEMVEEVVGDEVMVEKMEIMW